MVIAVTNFFHMGELGETYFAPGETYFESGELSFNMGKLRLKPGYNFRLETEET